MLLARYIIQVMNCRIRGGDVFEQLNYIPMDEMEIAVLINLTGNFTSQSLINFRGPQQ